jgi:DNA repair exonuclease SbcCD nuclease subunit
VKCLCLADLQLRNFNEFSSITEGGYNSRLVKLLDGLTQIIQKESPHILVIAGDLWNNKAALETDLLHCVHETFLVWKKWLKEIIILLGNHDTAFVSAEIHSLSQFQTFCKIIVEPQIYRGIAFSPWRPTVEQIEQDIKDLAGKASTLSDLKLGDRCLIGHWTVRGAATGNTLLTHGIDPWMPELKKFKQLILGDIHRSQRLGENILYLGSPAQNDFGEEGNFCQVWTLNTSTNELKSIPTNFPQLKMFSMTVYPERTRRNCTRVNVRRCLSTFTKITSVPA